MDKKLKLAEDGILKLGVDFLDVLFPRGIMKGSSIIFSAEISTSPECFLFPFICQGIRDDEYVIFINYSRPPADSVRMLTLFLEGDLRELEIAMNENRFVMFDCYREGAQAEEEKSVINLATSAFDPTKILHHILSRLDDVPNRAEARLAFDNLSTFSLNVEEKVLLRFFRRLLVELRHRKVISMFLVYRNSHDSMFLNTLHYLANIVIETDRKEIHADRVISRAKILKAVEQDEIQPNVDVIRYEIDDQYRAVSLDWPRFSFSVKKG